MKRILFSLLILLVSASISAQVTVYEFKDEKSYCTFEIDTQLAPDTVQTKGIYRAYDYYDIPFFEMTFNVHSYVAEDGKAKMVVTPIFYYHSFRAQLIGQREAMNSKQFRLIFDWNGDKVTHVTSDEDKKKMLKKSAYAEKGNLDFTQMPESFTKVKSVEWKKYPKDLRKNLQDKDKTLGRKY